MDGLYLNLFTCSAAFSLTVSTVHDRERTRKAHWELQALYVGSSFWGTVLSFWAFDSFPGRGEEESCKYARVSRSSHRAGRL